MTSPPTLRIWRPPHFRDVEIHAVREQALVMPRHFHDEIQIAVCEGGVRRLQIGTRVHDATAKLQLADGRPATEIAATLGFADQSHFARTFRRFVGMAPGRYRRCFVTTP